MITKNQIRFVKSLQQKKYRNENRLFVVEGKKSVEEVVASNYVIHSTYVSRKTEIPNGLTAYKEISSKEMERISGLKSAPGILSVVKMNNNHWDYQTSGLTIILDDIKDPGNLGTIIRTADWFGVSRIICSENTVDSYNPKVIQATMGAIFHVPIHYYSLESALDVFKQNEVESYAAILDGTNLYKTNFPKDCVIIIGSESHGVSHQVINKSTHSVTIPSFGKAESLNASIACAVILGVAKNSTN